MNTSTPAVDSNKVPVVFEAKVKVTSNAPAKNAADVRRILDDALERIKKLTEACLGENATIEGTVKIGTQKFDL